MEEILLQTIIEKLESFAEESRQLNKILHSISNYDPVLKEINDKIRSIQIEIQAIPSQMSISGKEIQAQRKAMVLLTEQLKIPLQQKVKTVGYLRPILLLCVVQMGIVVLLIAWIYMLYFGAEKKGNESTNPEINTPVIHLTKEKLPKVHKTKTKIYSKIPIEDSISRVIPLNRDSAVE